MNMYTLSFDFHGLDIEYSFNGKHETIHVDDCLLYDACGDVGPWSASTTASVINLSGAVLEKKVEKIYRGHVVMLLTDALRDRAAELDCDDK